MLLADRQKEHRAVHPARTPKTSLSSKNPLPAQNRVLGVSLDIGLSRSESDLSDFSQQSSLDFKGDENSSATFSQLSKEHNITETHGDEDDEMEHDSSSGSGWLKRNRKLKLFFLVTLCVLFIGVGAIIVVALVGGGDDDGENDVVGASFGIFGSGGRSSSDDDDAGETTSDVSAVPVMTTHAPVPIPTGSPTLVPTSIPTSTPTTSPPTLLPTTSDTVSIAISFSVAATASPTTEESVALKSTVATNAGVSESSIVDFSVTTSTTRRLIDETPSHRQHRQLAVTWDVSFTIRASLSKVDGSPAGPTEFTSKLQSTLSNTSFAEAVTAAIPNATVDTDSVALLASTRNPSAVPTSSPTLQITSPPDSGYIVLTPGLVRLALSGTGELFYLSKVTTTDASDAEVVAGRSYDGFAWEPAPALPFVFDCDLQGCVVSLPDTDDDDDVDVEYRLVRSDVLTVSESKSLASRFLTQATFGPTRSSIESFLDEQGGRPEEWLSAQMTLEPTLHRAYWRERTNPRLLVSTGVGGPREPCDAGSRWHLFAITHEDRGKEIEVADIAGTENVTLTIDSILRTVVPKRSFNTSSPSLSGLEPYTICDDLQEVVGGEVYVGADCDVAVENPAIIFTSEAPMPENRLVIQASSESAFTAIRRVVDTAYPNSGSLYSDKAAPNQAFVLSSNATSSDLLCSEAATASSGPLFATTPSGAVLLHDSRLQFLENTLASPVESPATDEECPSVPKTFLNADSCVPNRKACSSVLFTSSEFILNDTSIKNFYEFGGHYVHAVEGLLMDDVESPCASLASRWMKTADNSSTCASTSSVDSATSSILVAALEEAIGTSNSPNPMVLDITIDSACSGGTEVVGAQLYVNSSGCWQHVHENELSVFDFSFWTVAHDGNTDALSAGRQNPIMKFALAGSPTLTFPASSSISPHPMSRWDTGLERLTYLGNYGDVVDFADLPANSQSVAMAEHVGSVGAYAEEGFEACGSPGEVANDPSLGHRYYSWLGTGLNAAQSNQRETMDGNDHWASAGKQVLWTTVAMKAGDQLRQRVAWALAQIFVICETGVSKASENEPWHIYTDIFVRNAFSNYRTVMKEVSYSAMMAKMLTFFQSKSLESSGTYPDENYAREIMQLFSIGLWRLNKNGTLVTDSSGNYIPTYTNDDIVTGARAWTGFDVQTLRGNVENPYLPGTNYIDPMQVKISWRDYEPKVGLTVDGVASIIGDGYPLCVNLPKRPFLRKGAVYHYRGPNPLPSLQTDKTVFGEPTLSDGSVVERFELLPETSQLYAALCNASATTGECRFKSEVVLTKNLDCDGMECNVDTARTVQVNTTDNGEPFTVYFEYVRPACVELSYYDDPKTIAARGGGAWNSYPHCADPNIMAAQPACCGFNPNNLFRAVQTSCEYHGERMTWASASAKCEDYFLYLCTFDYLNDDDRDYTERGCDSVTTSSASSVKFWSTYGCTLHTTIFSDGTVAISHVTELEWDSELPLSTASTRSFRILWTDDAFPTVESGCSNNDGCVVDGTDCVCNITVITNEAVFNGSTAMPSKSDIVSSLSIGAFDPAMYDNGTFVACTDGVCANDQGVVAWLWKGEDPDPNPYECLGNVTIALMSAGNLDGNFASLDIAYDGVDSNYDDSWMDKDYNVVVLHPISFEVIDRGGPFNIRDDHLVAANATLAFLQAIPDGSLVAILIKKFNNNNGVSYLSDDLIDYMSTSFGSQYFGSFTNFRDSYGLLGYKGAAAPLAEETTPIRTGYVNFTVTLSCESTYQPSSAPTPAPTAVLPFDADTVFEVPSSVPGEPSSFYLNMRSTVSLGDYSFRNPPRFISRNEPTVRDAQYETDAMLDMYFNHPNVAPFVALRLIQRFVSSNPSPRYVEAVATAFETGSYNRSSAGYGGGNSSIEFGTGARGDLAATIAAVLLDREARNPVLDNDPGHGSLREPINKFLHLMRSMEFKQFVGHDEIALDDLIGQYPYNSPTVFNFFEVEYTPAGAISDAQLVSPESELLIAPNMVAFVNGAVSLVKYGLTDCDGGLGIIRDNSCWHVRNGYDYKSAAGNLSLSLPLIEGNATAVVSELDVLLTSGRLSARSRSLIEAEYTKEFDADGGESALKVAQELMTMTPEFHATSNNLPAGSDRFNAGDLSYNASSVEGDSSDTSNYKAVVYLYLDGACDSFNVLVPHSDCEEVSGTDMYAQYAEVRGDIIALSQSELLSINASSSTSQPCRTFGIHPSLTMVQQLYEDGDASFLANIGPMVEPVTKAEYEAGSKEVPPNLFAHNIQRNSVQNMAPQYQSTAKGILGRVKDQLVAQGYSVGAYSIHGNCKALEPDTSDAFDVIDMSNGVTTVDPYDTSTELMPAIANITAPISQSVFSETWNDLLTTTMSRTTFLKSALDATELDNGDFAADDTKIGKQFNQVARLIHANSEFIHNDRDAFYVHLGGFDTHTDDGGILTSKLTDINAALVSFVAEMKAQGLWEQVTIMSASDFGRTLTNNGAGTDHAWAGNDMLMGGSVKGGYIHGTYPWDLSDDGELNIGRGRLIPTNPLEAVWSGLATWFGVEESSLDTILPNLANFPSSQIFDAYDLFDSLD